PEDRGDAAVSREEWRAPRARRHRGRRRARAAVAHPPRAEPTGRLAPDEERYRASPTERHPRAARRRGDQPPAVQRARLGSAGIRARRSADRRRSREARTRGGGSANPSAARGTARYGLARQRLREHPPLL